MINFKFRGKCIKTGNWVYGGGMDTYMALKTLVDENLKPLLIEELGK